VFCTAPRCGPLSSATNKTDFIASGSVQACLAPPDIKMVEGADTAPVSQLIMDYEDKCSVVVLAPAKIFMSFAPWRMPRPLAIGQSSARFTTNALERKR
jgi:hypothetical protein